MKTPAVALALGLSIAACTGTLAEQGHPCPCASQWTCCASTSLCVEEGTACPAADSGVAPVSEPEAGTDAMSVDSAVTLEASSTPETLTIDGGVGGLCSAADAGTGQVTGDDAGSSSDANGDAPAAAVSCGCTRRPGTGNSFQCPAGIGEYSTATIGASGGTVQVQGRQGIASGVPAQLSFPVGAITTPTDVTLIETAIAPPQDLLDWSPVYLVEPAGLTLAVRTPIEFPWSSGSSPTSQGGPSSTTTTGLALWFSADGTCFTRVPDSYTNAGFEEGSTTQLGYFIVGTPRTAATATCP
jgi:hypothetical protein